MRIASPMQANALIPKRHYHENVIDHYENPRNVGSMDKKVLLLAGWYKDDLLLLEAHALLPPTINTCSNRTHLWELGLLVRRLVEMWWNCKSWPTKMVSFHFTNPNPNPNPDPNPNPNLRLLGLLEMILFCFVLLCGPLVSVPPTKKVTSLIPSSKLSAVDLLSPVLPLQRNG